MSRFVWPTGGGRLIGERVDLAQGYVMSFYLAVWNSGTAISSDGAATLYLVVRDEQSVTSKFEEQVYAFYSRLTSKYPEIEMVPEEELDACPRACGLDVAYCGPCRSIRIGLLRPPGRRGSPAPALGEEARRFATGSACAAEPQPAAMQVNDDPKAGGGNDVPSSAK